MPVQRLDHVNIRTHDLEATQRFYVDVIGLRVGDRPPFNFPGLWLYDDNVAVIHVTGLDSSDPRDDNSGSIDHVAFRVDGLAAMRERVAWLHVDAQECIVPRTGDLQIFLRDPNGVKIELTFAASEVLPRETVKQGSR
jgi:catechol 2,3-dioxygenase-like lactoylglutathione lyase family enzyme